MGVVWHLLAWHFLCSSDITSVCVVFICVRVILTLCARFYLCRRGFTFVGVVLPL